MERLKDPLERAMRETRERGGRTADGADDRAGRLDPQQRDRARDDIRDPGGPVERPGLGPHRGHEPEPGPDCSYGQLGRAERAERAGPAARAAAAAPWSGAVGSLGADDGFDWADPAPPRRSGRLVMLLIVVAAFAAVAGHMAPDLAPHFAPLERVAAGLATAPAPERAPDRAAMPALGPVQGGSRRVEVTGRISGQAGTQATGQSALSDQPASDPQASRVFSVPADEVLGYAEGRGLSNLAYGLLEGTHCKLGPGATVVWHRDRPGGAACRVLLFDRGGLRSGWRIARVRLRLGYGTAVLTDRGGEQPAAVWGEGDATVLELDTRIPPAQFQVQGLVPLTGAHFWVALDRFEIEGPPGATDWHRAFVRGIAALE